ncbi:MAG: glycosyltransferase [Ignavibacteria bacterium]|nr:glycosyltransferase [Ignavibacteria bacterium]
MEALSIFEIVFIITIAFYTVQQKIFITGFRRKLKTNDNYVPSVTIIVAARNEERNIRECLRSLVQIDYPREKLEIIIVDDYSSDNTGKIIDEFSAQFPFVKKIIPTQKIISKPGKTNAIVNGIKNSKGEIIFTTDADCVVQPTWIKTQIKYFTDNVGVVTGFTFQKAYSQFTGMQNLDWVYLLTVAAGTINLGLPLSCIGNNMAYRRDAYDWVGGYENIKFSVTEDFALLHKIHKHTHYDVVFPTDPEGINQSEPCPDWKTLYRQKHRWGIGGLDAPFVGFVIMFWGWFSHLLILLQIMFGSVLTLFLTAIKFLSDFIFLLIPLKKFKMVDQLKYFFAFEIYFILYVLILPFVVFFDKKVIWKEREY